MENTTSLASTNVYHQNSIKRIQNQFTSFDNRDGYMTTRFKETPLKNHKTSQYQLAGTSIFKSKDQFDQNQANLRNSFVSQNNRNMNIIQSIPVQHLKDLRGSLDLNHFGAKIDSINERNFNKFSESLASNQFKSVKERKNKNQGRQSEVFLNDQKKSIYSKFDFNRSNQSIDSTGSNVFQKRSEFIMPVQQKFEQAQTPNILTARENDSDQKPVLPKLKLQNYETFDRSYAIPKGELQRLPCKSFVIKKLPKKYTFIDTYIKSKNIVPGSNKYHKAETWCQLEKNVRPKGKFLDQKKITITDKIFVDDKKYKRPGPDKYDFVKGLQYKYGKVPGCYQQKDKIICYTDEVKNLVSQYPPQGIYKDVNLEIFKDRSQKWNIVKDKSLGTRLQKLKPDNSPSPASYRSEESFMKTQYGKKDKFNKFSAQKLISFIDKNQQIHKFVPGAGTYKNVEAAYLKLSKTPSSQRSRRH